jgi:hypothetical protein
MEEHGGDEIRGRPQVSMYSVLTLFCPRRTPSPAPPPSSPPSPPAVLSVFDLSEASTSLPSSRVL